MVCVVSGLTFFASLSISFLPFSAFVRIYSVKCVTCCKIISISNCWASFSASCTSNYTYKIKFNLGTKCVAMYMIWPKLRGHLDYWVLAKSGVNMDGTGTGLIWMHRTTWSSSITPESNSNKIRLTDKWFSPNSLRVICIVQKCSYYHY